MSDAKPKKPAKPAKVAGKGSTTVLNEQKLVALGAERLASLLLEAAADDLDAQRGAILEVGRSDAAEALELMWQFMALARSVLDRSDDSNGRIGDVFRAACQDLGPLAEEAKPNVIALADRVCEACLDNGYGQSDALIATLATALGPTGLRHLKQRFEALAKSPPPTPEAGERRVVGYGSGVGAIYADELEARARESAIRLALQDIADAEDDVDAFIAQYDSAAQQQPGIVAQIAGRLVAAGRISEAVEFIEHANYDESGWPHYGFEDARIAVFEAAGEVAAAQDARWSLFERSLSTNHLRAFVAKLPDFEDQEALDRAFTHAAAFPSILQALAFFNAWPALEQAAKLALARFEEIDGNHYEILGPSAEALAGRHPLAATLLLRAMIDFTLQHARSSRYRHAARHLMDCAGLAGAIGEFGRFEKHDAYLARLRREHPRKGGFWSAVEVA